METSIGVFASRDGAEGAVKDLLGRGVPEQAIVFLTRAEAQSGTARHVGSKVAATLMSVPGIGQVFALGLGAAALLGLGGNIDTAAAPLSDNPISVNPALQPTPDENCSDDVVFFRDLLQQGRSLVVVRPIPPLPTATVDWTASAWDYAPYPQQRCRPPPDKLVTSQ